MKQIFTSHDLLTVVTELQKMGLEGAYLQNCYDVTKRSLILRFSGHLETDLETKTDPEHSDSDPEEKTSTRQKIHLMIESGARVHLVDKFTAVRQAPTGFCMKLRKHLKNRKLVAIRQINRDRVVDFVFGSLEDEEHCHHLVVELYASGNVLLLEGKTHKILMLLHPHIYQEGETDTRVKIGAVYPWKLATAQPEDYEITSSQLQEWLETEIPKLSKRIKLRQFLTWSPLGIFGPVWIDHLLASYGLGGKIGPKDAVPFTPEQLAEIPEKLNTLHQTPGKGGYLIVNEKGDYDSYTPAPYAHLKGKTLEEYPSFLSALTTYYAPLDQARMLDLAGQQEQKKVVAEKKKLDQTEKTTLRIQEQLSQMEEKRSQSEARRHFLESQILDLTSILTTLKLRSQDRNREFADLSTPGLRLVRVEPHRDLVHLETEVGPVQLNYQLSIFKNLQNLHETRKTLQAKEERTQEVLSQVQTRKNRRGKFPTVPIEETHLMKERKSHWFEKYAWFYTSVGDLCVVGKTAQQNEELVKKYLTPQDRYLHSEVAGSGSGILKRPDPSVEWSPRSLEEAGAFLVCHTKAWEANTPNKAYWVEPDQVSKTPETGEYVTKGSFIIRGKKNFLSLPKLQLGITLLAKNKGVGGLTAESDADLEYLLPMVAPYSCLKDHKFRVKITPGKGKLGKGIKEIQTRFHKVASPLERTALGLVADDDWHRVMVSKITLT